MNDMNPSLAKEIFAVSQSAFSGDLPKDWDALKEKRDQLGALLSRTQAVESQSRVLTQLLNQTWDEVTSIMEELNPSPGPFTQPLRPGGRHWSRN